ncbi:MAG: flagellar brake protein [Planctomycetota bacterium]
MAHDPRLPRLLAYSPARVLPAGAEPFPSHVLDVSDDGARVLLEQADPAQYGVVHTGQELRVEFDDGVRLWAFATRVLERLPRAEAGFWCTRPLDAAAYESAQQRETLRARVQCPVTISVPDGQSAVPVRGETVDLGGGGARVRTKAPLPVDAVVRVRLLLQADQPPLQAQARVVASEPVADGAAPGLHEGRLEFVELDDAARTDILQRCFRLQLEQRRRQVPLE